MREFAFRLSSILQQTARIRESVRVIRAWDEPIDSVRFSRQSCFFCPAETRVTDHPYNIRLVWSGLTTDDSHHWKSVQPSSCVAPFNGCSMGRFGLPFRQAQAGSNCQSSSQAKGRGVVVERSGTERTWTAGEDPHAPHAACTFANHFAQTRHTTGEI